MATQTHYDTLCVPATATPDEIKISWRRLVRNFHPDTAGESGIVMTQRLNAAYTVVGSPDARRAYDRDLLLDAEPVAEPTSQPTPTPTAPTAPTAAWDPARYRALRKVSLIAYAVIGVGIVVAAAALNSTASSFWLAPIGFAAVLTAARGELKLWRAATLGLAIAAGPLGAIGIFGLSNWANDAGPVPMTAQAVVAVAAFVAHSVSTPIRALRAARPRK